MRSQVIILLLLFPLLVNAQKHGRKNNKVAKQDTTGYAAKADSLLLLGMDYASRAISLQEDSLFDVALNYYHEALDYDSTVCDTWNNIGTVYSQRKEDRMALYYFERAVRVKPHYVAGWYNIAVSYYSLEIPDSVFYYSRVCIGMDSTYVKAYQLIGLEYYKIGKKKQAIEWLNRSAQVDPKNVFTWSTLSQYDYEVGDTMGSVEATAHWAELEPNDFTKWDKLAMFYKVHHDQQKFDYYTRRAQEARKNRDLYYGH
ncbi:MAG TPA: hypothetical protein VL651_07070 [Bacteroidia bacterium]|nr:hypothetical protein [Bacteroidia bacterium]